MANGAPGSMDALVAAAPATDYEINAGDPSQNVLNLVRAESRRQDDLRIAEARAIRDMLGLRSDYDERLRNAETARIDAIRAVDVGAVNRAAEVASVTANTLATQVQASAETLRTQVAAAASAATIALAAALEPVQKDIADLRRAQYEAQGQKTQVVETQTRGASIGLWVGVAAAVLFGFVGVIGAVAAVVVH